MALTSSDTIKTKQWPLSSLQARLRSCASARLPSSSLWGSEARKLKIVPTNSSSTEVAITASQQRPLIFCAIPNHSLFMSRRMNQTYVSALKWLLTIPPRTSLTSCCQRSKTFQHRLTTTTSSFAISPARATFYSTTTLRIKFGV